MSLIFDQLHNHAEIFKNILKENLKESDEMHDFPWTNLVYTGNGVRRAHLDIVDKREDKKLYMMHLCIFPEVYSDAPIYGFDLIAGPNKVTGAFHDFSPVNNLEHPLVVGFSKSVKGYSWSKERELPEWAKAIFSPYMVAAGNVRDQQELSEVLNLSSSNLLKHLSYLSQEDKVNEKDNTEYQNRYCQFQKQNPHTPRVMESLGYDPETVQTFIQTCLFPEI